MKLGAFFIFTTLIFGPAARAGLMVDFDVSSFQDTTTTGTSASQTKSYYGGGLYVPVDGRDTFYLGASLISAASSDDNGSSVTAFSTTDYILGFRYFMDKSRTFIASGGYGVQANATYKSGSAATESWRGNSYLFKLTAAPAIRNWNVGLSMIFYQGTFTERVASNAVSTVSYTKTFVFPCLGVSYNW